MRKTANAKLKKLLAIFILSITMMMGFVFVSCANRNYDAEFKKEGYVVSIGETIDITNDVELKNITMKDLSFYSSDTSLLRIENADSFSQKNRTTFTAIKPGFVTIYIYYRGEALDTAKVTIKNNFMVPTNIQVSNNGLITWNKVSMKDAGGKTLNAKYSIMISTDDIDYEVFETTTNSYQLTEQGRYFVKVKALASSLADESAYSEKTELYYNTVVAVENLHFSSQADGSGLVSWTSSSNADYYIIKLNEAESTEEITTNSKEIDLSMLAPGESITVSVKACSFSNEITDSPYITITVLKLGVGNKQVEDGEISWTRVSGAASYNVKYELVSDSTVFGTINTANLSTTLEGLDEGVYNISLQAVATTSPVGGVYYANSEVVEFAQVAKLGLPTVDYDFTDGQLNLSLSTANESVKKFYVRIFEKATRNQTSKVLTITSEISQGVYTVEDSFALPVQGVYDVYVTTLIDGIESITIKDVQCSNAIRSDEGFELTIVNLPTLENVTHRYDSEDNSIITFNRPSYEILYSIPLNFDTVTINGQAVVVMKTYDSMTQTYSLNLGKITKDYIDGNNSNNYVISVTVDTANLPNSEALLGVDKITKVCSKTLTMLTVSTMGLDQSELTGNYTYSAQNASYYEYNLYETDDTFVVSDYTRENGVIDNYGRITKPSAGYYSVYVLAYPANPNLYLIGEGFDSFYVTQTLESATLDFGKTSVKLEDGSTQIDENLLSGYYVKINAVSGATNYNVYLNNVLLGNVTDGDNDNLVYYYFAADKDFASGTFTVKVVAKGDNDFIYLQSESSIIVERLATPGSVNLNDQAFELSSANNLHFYKNTISNENMLVPTTSQSGALTTYNVNLESIYGTFSVLVYASKANVENERYYLDSQVASYNIRKIATPTELKLNSDSIEFIYTDSNAVADASHIGTVAVVTIESPSTELVDFEYTLPLAMLTTTPQMKVSFVLEDLIEALEGTYANFESLYLQKDSIRLQIYIDCSYYNATSQEYVLSSQKAISATNVNLSYITIEKLQSVELYFNELQKMIYWVGEYTEDFEITLNNSVIAQSASYNTDESRFELDVSAKFDDPLCEGNFYNYKVRKVAPSYLSSNYSNEISLYFLRKVASVNVVTDVDNNSRAVFTYNDNNIDKIKIEINVNRNELIEVATDQTRTSYQFELDEEIVSYVINVVGYYETDAGANKTTYYISSSSNTFGLSPFESIASVENISINDASITWTNYGDSFNYLVYFDRVGSRDAKLSVGENSLSLANTVLQELSVSDYDVLVYAVYKNFAINAGEERYYGGSNIAAGTVYKLQGANNVSLNINESSTTILTEKSVVPALAWVWNESHTTGANVTFEIKLNGTLLNTVSYVSGISNYSYNIQQGLFGDLNNTISIRVLSDKDVASNVVNLNIYKFTAANITVSDSKILNITYTTTNSSVVASNGYVVKVTVGGHVTEFATSDSSINLDSAIGTYSGDYRVDVLIKNVTNVAICPANVASVTGVVLQRPTITQTTSGINITSTDTNVSYLLSIKKNDEYLVQNVVTNGIYTFPDDYSGSYVLEVVATSVGKLNSAVKTQNISITRLDEVENVVLTRTRTFSQGETTEYTFTWDAVVGAISYQCVVYSNTNEVLLNENVSTCEISFDEEDIEDLGGSGTYYLGLRAIGNISSGLSNSVEARANLSIEQSVDSIALTEDGLLAITGHGDILLYAYNGVDELNVILRQADATPSGDDFVYTYFVGTLTGRIYIQAIVLGNEDTEQENVSTFMIDSLVEETSFDKLQEIASVSLNSEDGKIYITLSESLASGTYFNFKTTESVVAIAPEAYGETDYAFDFIDIFSQLEIESSGEQTVELYLTKAGTLRSESYEFDFDYTQTSASDYTQNRGIDLMHDYLLIHPKAGQNIKLIVVTLASGAQTQTLTLTALDYLGYWHTTTEGAYFSTVNDGSAISSEEVYALPINEIVTRNGNSTLSVAYIYITSGNLFGINDWSESLSYEKLPPVSEVYASGGVISWSLSASSNYASVTGYYVIFKDQSGDSQIIYISSHETRRVTTEDLISANKKFEVSVVSVSTMGANKLASNGVDFRHLNGNKFKVIKANETTSAIEINDGVLSISLSRPNEDSAYGRLYGETLLMGTTLSENENDEYYMPYGYGRKSEDDEVNVGTGTFTAFVYRDQIMYLRTEFIDGTYTLTQDAYIYSEYNVSIDDVLDNWNTKYTTSQNCVEALASKLFTYPFAFTMESLTAQTNKFELTFKNAFTMEETKMIVDGVEIVQKTDYVAELESLLDGISDSVAGKETVSMFLEMMGSNIYFTGLASSNLLFDNIGRNNGSMTGESIDVGNYDIYLTQIGFEIPNTQIGNETYILTSPKVKVFDTCRVEASPVVKTYRSLNADGYSYNYYLKFAPSYISGVMLENYRLVMQYGENSIAVYDIKYEIDEWNFYKTEFESFVLSVVNEGGIDYVLIPLNNANGLNILLDNSFSYVANVYSVGSTTRLCSKTEPINITFLGFNSAIKLTMKGFEWSSYSDGVNIYPTTVIYKRASESTARISAIRASTGISRFNPAFDGLYNYIMFIAQGNIGRYSVVVDSEIYRVENVFKLYAPTVTVNWEGNFAIQNSSNNPVDYVLPTYKITNSVSEDIHARRPNDEELFVTTTSSTYKAGAIDAPVGSYKETEEMTAEYYFVSVGDERESFEVRVYNDGEYYLLDYGENMLFMSSEKATSSAALLNNPTSIFINSNGDVEWTSVEDSVTDDLLAEFNDGETIIIYKVVVEYYHETFEGLTKDAKTDTYYTKSNVLPASYIEGTDETIDYTYKVIIYAFPAFDSDSLNGILTTLNNDLKNENVYYAGGEYLILANAGAQHSFKRLNDVENIAIVDGLITWESEYTEDLYNFVVKYNGPATSGELLGEYTYDSATGKYIFVLDDDNRTLSSELQYTISVFVSAKNSAQNRLTSFEKASTAIRILPSVEENHITKTSEEINNVRHDTYDIKPFFTQHRSEDVVRYSNVFVKFKTYNISTGNLISANSNNFILYYNSEDSYKSRFTIVNDTGVYDEINEPYKLYLAVGHRIEIEIQVVATGDNYINSYKYDFTLSKNDWTALDTIVYDDSLNHFVWTYGKEISGSEYEGDIYYRVSITYRTRTQKPNTYYDETSYTRLYENVQDKFFMPELAGYQVAEFKVQARIGYNNINSDWKAYDGEVVTFNLFASGAGSQANPYMIASAQQFANMDLLGDKPTYLLDGYKQTTVQRETDANGYGINAPTRTETYISSVNSTYYFKLANDIALESTGEFIIANSFGSNFDGDGRTIAFTSQGGINPGTVISGRVAQGDDSTLDLSFNQVGALFGSIAETGVVENLKLSVAYAYSPYSGGVKTDALFAGLVLINNGNVRQVELTSFAATMTTEISNTFTIAGIVGINHNNVSLCTITAGIYIENSFATGQSLYLGGVVGFNEGQNANITLCQTDSTAVIRASLTNSQNGIVQCGGIALSNVNGHLSLCGNNGIVTSLCDNGTAYASGIIVYSTGGSVIDSFNSSNVTGKTNYSAGIVYSCNSTIGNIFGFGKVNSATVSSYIIAKQFTGTITGNCYASQSYSIVVNTTAIASTQQFTTSNEDYRIRVAYAGGNYSVSFLYVE